MSDEMNTTDDKNHNPTAAIPVIGATKAKGPAAESPPPPEDQPKGKKKKGRMELYLGVVGAMQRLPLAAGPSFPDTYRVIVDDRGVRRPVQILLHKEVVNVDDDAVKTGIIRYSHLLLKGKAPLSPNEARTIFELWRALEEPLTEADIHPVAQKSTPGYTWRRLPWDFDDSPEAPTPTFDEMMARTGNSAALMAWIGGLFVDDSDRQQYVYLHGQGRNGKGRLADFLARVFGPAYRSEFIQGKPNNFWTSGLMGSRLVVFPDFEAPDFPNSGFFKSLTGGDRQRVEMKGKQAFTTELHCKFMLLANDPPNLSESVANRRRAIYCDMEAIPEGMALVSTKAYGARLWAEGPAWLARCVAMYHKATEETGVIPTADEALTSLIDEHEAPFLDIMRRWFVVDKIGDTHPGQMQEILRREKMCDFRSQSKFFGFLVRRYGVKKVRKRIGDREDNERERVYLGVKVSETGLLALMKM